MTFQIFQDYNTHFEKVCLRSKTPLSNNIVFFMACGAFRVALKHDCSPIPVFFFLYPKIPTVTNIKYNAVECLRQ